ncbi:hypothetical protein OUZ56_012716 [Daphnia magna]|uniref:Uncharacterized protein n=1 Tax=Daphnia magna TaxID=35525 RepID=A0ABQ9Z3U5_9CRUS|nr:hypothetical protein OUZ56_012716 [Daphnia magna]
MNDGYCIENGFWHKAQLQRNIVFYELSLLTYSYWRTQFKSMRSLGSASIPMVSACSCLAG